MADTKTKTSCKNDGEFCGEHSGVKVMVFSILAAALANLGLLMYNTFITSATLKNDVIQSVTELKGKFAVLEQTDKYMMDEINDCKMRMAKIESGKK